MAALSANHDAQMWGGTCSQMSRRTNVPAEMSRDTGMAGGILAGHLRLRRGPPSMEGVRDVPHVPLLSQRPDYALPVGGTGTCSSPAPPKKG